MKPQIRFHKDPFIGTKSLRNRRDEPGAWHHVFNRGMSHRPVFDGGREVDLFQDLLAEQCEKGVLEVCAFTFLTTHYHLLVRSPSGELAQAMQRVKYRFVRRFNAPRGRDGSLFRSRFRSRRIEDEDHWWNVLGYIDMNPVDAGITANAAEYSYGSARHYACGEYPEWVQHKPVEQRLARAFRVRTFAPDLYQKFLRACWRNVGSRELVERLVAMGASGNASQKLAHELRNAAPAHVQQWLEECALRADGGCELKVVASAHSITRAVNLECGDTRAAHHSAHPIGLTMLVGLLLSACGCTRIETAARTELCASTLRGLLHRHTDLLKLDSHYREMSTRVLQKAMALDRLSLDLEQLRN